MYQYKLRADLVESSSVEDLVNKRMAIKQKCALVTKGILGCTKNCVASRSRLVLLPLCSGEASSGVLFPILVRNCL